MLSGGIDLDKNAKLELIYDAKATLGEGPCWDQDKQVLYWVDIIKGRVHVHNQKDETNQVFEIGQYVGTVSVAESGELILALQHGFYLFDMETRELKPIDDPEKELPNNRFNDGKCDPAGRFLAGTMSLIGEGNVGALYSLDKDFTVKKLVDYVGCSNGLAWSADFQTMYYIDSPTKQVVAYDYDLKTGNIQNKREVIRIPEGEGVPDGMTIDEEGMLWVAQWGGYKVSRWNPQTGERIYTISVPVAKVTSCVFGGENRDELYITTASEGLSEAELKEQPLAGGLFRYKVGVKGAPMYKFKGKWDR